MNAGAAVFRGTYLSLAVTVLLYGIIFTYAYLISNIAPLMTGAFIHEGGLSARAAGTLISLYLGSMAIAAFATTSLVGKISVRALAFIGISVASGACLIPIAFAAPGIFEISMLIGGFGNGMLFTSANASAANERYPVLLYGFGVVAGCLAAAAVPPVFLAIVKAWSIPGIFAIPLAFAPLVLCSLLALPRGPTGSASAVTEHVPQKRELSIGAIPGAWLLLIAIFLMDMVQMGFFNFFDQLLRDAGFDEVRTAATFTNLFLVAAVGGAIACALASLPQHLFGVVIGLTLLLTVSIIVAIFGSSNFLILLSLYANGVLSMLIIPVQLAVAASLDTTGKLAAGASGALFLSWTVGPTAAGWTLDQFGFGGIALVAAIAGAVSFAALILVRVLSKNMPHHPSHGGTKIG